MAATDHLNETQFRVTRAERDGKHVYSIDGKEQYTSKRQYEFANVGEFEGEGNIFSMHGSQDAAHKQANRLAGGDVHVQSVPIES